MTDTRKPWDAGVEEPLVAIPPIPPLPPEAEVRLKAGMVLVPSTEPKRPCEPNVNWKEEDDVDPSMYMFEDPMEEIKARMSVSTIKKYDAFVLEWFKDADCTAAWLRAGGSPENKSYGYTLIKHPYVKIRIQQLLDEMRVEDIVNAKEVVMGLKREAHYFGEGAVPNARVSSLKILAQMHGMLINRVEQKTTHSGGVMVVPARQSVEEWEEMAASSQEQLKNDVRK